MTFSDGENMNGECQGAKKPAITLQTTHLFVPQGGTAILLCRAEGIPRSEIFWYDMNDELIVNNDMIEDNVLMGEQRVAVTANGDLIIKHLRWEDMGTYRCVAKNRHGRTEVTSFLYPVKVISCLGWIIIYNEYLFTSSNILYNFSICTFKFPFDVYKNANFILLSER